METVLNLVFNAENVRMLVTLAFVCSSYVLLNSKMGRMESSLNKRIDGVENTIEALTFTLEKNGFLKREDKEYVDSRLAR